MPLHGNLAMECVCPILERSTPVAETGFCRDSWSLVRCLETGFVFLANPPDYAQLQSELAWEKTYAAECARRDAEEPLVSFVSSFAKTAKLTVFPRRNKMASLTLSAAEAKPRTETLSLLDIGCGWGCLLLEICDRFAHIGQPVVPYGIEVSEELAAHTDNRVAPLGGKVISMNALDGISHFGRESIDVVTMSSFLEHECRPLSLLRRLHPILTAGGAIILKVPNFACWNRMVRGRKWCGFRFPDHVNYFTPRTLRRLAREAGFTVSRQTFLDKFAFSDNMYAVLMKSEERCVEFTAGAGRQGKGSFPVAPMADERASSPLVAATTLTRSLVEEPVPLSTESSTQVSRRPGSPRRGVEWANTK